MSKALLMVTNATGKTGVAVVRLLRSRGLAVRAHVRRRSARSDAIAALGAQVVVADPLNAAQMRAALVGATSVYHLPPFHPSMLAAATVLADVAPQAGVESLVVLSQWLASPRHPAWLTRQLWEMEQLLGRLPLQLTIVAPPFFADNYLRLIGYAAHLGILPSLTGDSRNAPPSTEDIAAVIAESLIAPAAHAGRRYVPTGPSLLSTADMAQILSRVLDRRVRRVELPMWLFLKAARLQGVTAEELSGFRYWVRDHRAGAFSFNLPTHDVAAVTGRSAEDFETIARRYALIPEARRSFSSDARAWFDFMRTPVAPGFDLDRFDRERGLAAPVSAQLAMQSPIWRARRPGPATQAGLAVDLAGSLA